MKWRSTIPEIPLRETRPCATRYPKFGFSSATTPTAREIWENQWELLIIVMIKGWLKGNQRSLGKHSRVATRRELQQSHCIREFWLGRANTKFMEITGGTPLNGKQGAGSGIVAQAAQLTLVASNRQVLRSVKISSVATFGMRFDGTSATHHHFVTLWLSVVARTSIVVHCKVLGHWPFSDAYYTTMAK